MLTDSVQCPGRQARGTTAGLVHGSHRGVSLEDTADRRLRYDGWETAEPFEKAVE